MGLGPIHAAFPVSAGFDVIGGGSADGYSLAGRPSRVPSSLSAKLAWEGRVPLQRAAIFHCGGREIARHSGISLREYATRLLIVGVGTEGEHVVVCMGRPGRPDQLVMLLEDLGRINVTEGAGGGAIGGGGFGTRSRGGERRIPVTGAVHERLGTRVATEAGLTAGESWLLLLSLAADIKRPKVEAFTLINGMWRRGGGVIAGSGGGIKIPHVHCRAWDRVVWVHTGEGVCGHHGRRRWGEKLLLERTGRGKDGLRFQVEGV